MRFIAATAMYPEKQEQLRKVLEDMQVIETALIQAQEIEKRGDYAGAWESAEKAFRNFPDDNKLNQVRANLTTKAADFVHAIREAEELEQKKQPGSSLAWYLKAQKVYPPSDFARQGVDRLTKAILPAPREPQGDLRKRRTSGVPAADEPSTMRTSSLQSRSREFRRVDRSAKLHDYVFRSREAISCQSSLSRWLMSRGSVGRRTA
jgi:tetratricopeptide (TPR) repeat protein